MPGRRVVKVGRWVSGTTRWEQATVPPAWLVDVTPAAWIAPRLHPFNTDVGSVVPEGFAAYARIFHPVRAGGHRHNRRWAEVAAEHGRLVHPEMQFHLISRPLGGPAPSGGELNNALAWGSLPLAERAALGPLLAASTATPRRCWFCVWEGYGDLDVAGVTARVELPARRYLLAGAHLARMTELVLATRDQSANLWWPDDRSWIVITEIDYAWTYVGGSAGLIDRILSSPRLEALPARLADSPFRDGDALNAALDDQVGR